MTVRTVGQRVYKCECGQVSNAVFCPECDRKTVPVWEAVSGSTVLGYVKAFDLFDAVEKAEKEYGKVNVKTCYEMPVLV